jgi:hypothetical protein
MIMLQRKISNKILTASVLLFSQFSFSAFMIEPSIGYRQETLKLTSLLISQTQIKMNSPVYGIKMGFSSMLGISLDLAGTQSKGKTIFEPSVTENPDYTHNVGSAQVGVSAMGILKIYLGYILSDELEIQTNTSVSGFKLKGQGYQAGLMTFPFPRVGLGLQYNVHQFKEISGSGFTNGSDLKNYFEKVDAQDVSVNLSVLF